MVKNSLPTTIGMIINQYTKEFLNKSRGCIRIASFVSNENFDELLNSKSSQLTDIKINFRKKIHEEEDFTLWKYDISRYLNENVFGGNFLVLQNGAFVFLISGYSPLFFRNVMIYLTKRLHPRIISAYITAQELFELINGFSKAKKTELYHSNYVGKKLFGKPWTSLGYGTKPFQEAFKKAQSERPRVWIDSIRISSNNFTPIDFRIARNAHLYYYKGGFEDYFSLILAPIEEYSRKRMKMFEKRGRRETENKKLRPLLINYGSKLFEDSEIRTQLIDVIAKYEFCNFSVIHNGNPHVYMNIVDRLDNSTFSLRTFGSDSLVIMPQVKASNASLMRFSKHLMDNFLEGNISDFQR